MIIKSVLIDDEKNNVDNLSHLLALYCPEVMVVGTTTHSLLAAELILEKKPDLVFLDIQMPNKNGFDVLKQLTSIDFEVIFVTAFDHYGIQAIKFSALDYILKPIGKDELVQAVQKAYKKCEEKSKNPQLANLMEYIKEKENKAAHRIALPSSKETRFVEPSKIVRCESANNYTTFFLVSGEEILTSRPIYEYEEILDTYGFIRCHQSHLINLQFIKSWVKEDGGFLLCEDGSKVPVSRLKKDAVKSALEK